MAYVTQHIKYFKCCYSSHLLGARTVWILGSSIVKHAFRYARKSQFGARLKSVLQQLATLLPSTIIIWSHSLLKRVEYQLACYGED